MIKFVIKRNDTSPSLEGRLATETLQPIPLGNSSVVFNMRTDKGVVIIDRADVTIVDSDNGVVRYDWTASDTARTGTYQAEFEVTFSDGKVETFPKSEKLASNFITVTVTDDVA